MDCPRCQLGLTGAEYEGEEVQFCATCWGYWMTRDQLDRITSSKGYNFGKEEKQAVRHAMAHEGDADRLGTESQPVSCPACGVEMRRKRFTPDCPVMIDECDAHGVWLDTGEIKDLQVFLERFLR